MRRHEPRSGIEGSMSAGRIPGSGLCVAWRNMSLDTLADVKLYEARPGLTSLRRPAVMRKKIKYPAGNGSVSIFGRQN